MGCDAAATRSGVDGFVIGDDVDGVTSSDVTMLWSSGDGLKLKTIRLSLDAIAAWWVAKGTPLKALKDGNAFFGIAVPIDF